MNIVLNNRPDKASREGISMAELIIEKNFTFRFLVTKVNGQLVKKDDREKILIREGDQVDIIHLVSGG